MPYIKPESRPEIDELLAGLASHLASLPDTEQDGALNYAITKILHQVYPPRYYNYNRAIGALECIKLELYRRKVAPYEDEKITENGDVA